MRKAAVLLGLAVFMFIISGCGVRIHNPANDNASLVYGYIDMSEAPTKLGWASLKQLKPKTDKPYWGAGSNGTGVFWNEHITPGSYQLTEFGGGSFWKNATYTYAMPEYGKNDTAVVISKSGLYYLGSYKYKKEGSFFNPKFSIEKSKKPTEKEVLEMILPLSKGTSWEARIVKRMKALK